MYVGVDNSGEEHRAFGIDRILKIENTGIALEDFGNTVIFDKDGTFELPSFVNYPCIMNECFHYFQFSLGTS